MKKQFSIARVALWLHVAMLVIIILPRSYTRAVRHVLARLVMAAWVGVSRAFTMIHEDLWQRGNGH